MFNSTFKPMTLRFVIGCCRLQAVQLSHQSANWRDKNFLHFAHVCRNVEMSHAWKEKYIKITSEGLRESTSDMFMGATSSFCTCAVFFFFACFFWCFYSRVLIRSREYMHCLGTLLCSWECNEKSVPLINIIEQWTFFIKRLLCFM